MPSRRAQRRLKPTKPPKLSATLLQTGAPVRPALTIRLARPDEADRCAQLLRLADGAHIDPEMLEALAGGKCAGELMASLDHGREAIIASATRAMNGGDGLEEFVSGLCMVLVAENDVGLVGALYSLPPVGPLMGMVAEQQIRYEEALLAMMLIAKLKALAVDPDHRSAGIGSALIRIARQVYTQIGHLYLYGQFGHGSGLDRYYSDRGFTIIPTDQGLNLPFTGRSVLLAALPGEQLFACALQDPRYLAGQG